jgi:hypothetical protein
LRMKLISDGINENKPCSGLSRLDWINTISTRITGTFTISRRVSCLSAEGGNSCYSVNLEGDGWGRGSQKWKWLHFQETKQIRSGWQQYGQSSKGQRPYFSTLS